MYQGHNENSASKVAQERLHACCWPPGMDSGAAAATLRLAEGPLLISGLLAVLFPSSLHAELLPFAPTSFLAENPSRSIQFCSKKKIAVTHKG